MFRDRERRERKRGGRGRIKIERMWGGRNDLYIYILTIQRERRRGSLNYIKREKGNKERLRKEV